jgi:hypothetical protein
VIETYEYVGYWWVAEEEAGFPTDTSDRLSGTLTIKRGKAELVVLGSFGHEALDSSGTAFSPAPADVPRILGFSTTGKSITLEDCTRTDFELNFPGVPTTTYRPRVVLIDAWIGKEDPIVFDEISIRTSHLDMWVGISGFSETIGGGEQTGGSRSPYSIDVHFEEPTSLRVPLDHGEEAAINFGFRHSGMQPVTTGASLTQTDSLHLRFATSQPLEQVFVRAGQLRNFLTLAIGRPETILSVRGFKDDFVRRGAESRQPITLLWEIPHNPDPPNRLLHPIQMLFTLPQADLSDVMKAWFERQNLFEPVLNLYFGMLYHPDISIDIRFLTYAQAIETYDFRRRDPLEIPKLEHRRRLKAIFDGAPEEWRDWLKSRLAGSNFRTLDKRVRDVLAECPTVSAKIVGASSVDLDAFVTRFKRSRNYYTHYTPALERHAARGIELYAMTIQLRAIIEMSLLRELGFSCEAIDGILTRVERYAQILHAKEAASDDE